MRTIPVLRRAALAAFGALLLPLGAVDAQVERQRVDTSFTFERGGVVRLAIVSGEIRVTSVPGTTMRILATIERGRLETAIGRDRVSIEARSVGGRMGAARYELQVPVGTRVRADAVSGDVSVRGTTTEVEAHSVSGDVIVEDAAGIVEVESVSGDIDLRRAAGRIDVASVSGSIDIDGVEGDLEAESVSGSVIIRRGALRRLRTESVSGDLIYDGSIAADGDYRVNTHSGSVRFTIPSDGSATLELETWSGNIASDFPLTLQPDQSVGRRTRRMQFTIGRGGARIMAETFSGNITIRRVGSARNDQE